MDDWCGGQDNSHHSTVTAGAGAAVQVPIVQALETALRAESLPQAILSQLLNLAEFMELQVHMYTLFSIDSKRTANMATSAGFANMLVHIVIHSVVFV
jgi:hypothetical protein